MTFKTKMKVCLKALFIKNPDNDEASQLIFIECQMTDLKTQDLTERSLRTDVKITRTVKNY